MKKIWIGVLILIIAALAVLLVVTQTKRGPEEIKIGAILPLTGEAAKYGKSAKRGIDLALEEINAKGGIKGKKLTIIYEDSKGNPKEGVSAILKLITVHKVPAILGAMSSSVTLAIAPIAEENKIVLLSPASSSPKITHAGDYIFRNCYSDIYEGKKMAHYIYNETRYKKVAIIHINNDYGIGLREAFRDEFNKLGGKVVAVETYDFGATDFRTQLSKIKESDPDAIYIVGYSEMGRLLVQAKELELRIPFFSCIMFEDPDILKVAGDIAEGVVYTYPSYNPKSREDVVANFINIFEKKYNQKPDGFAANAYDALKILALAIEKGGGKSEQIKKALYSIKDYPGVTGKTSFDGNGDVIKPIGIKQSVRGKFKWIYFKY